MLEYEDALARVLAAMPAPVAEQVSLAQAHGRVLADRVVSPLDLPSFDNSAMDGYAVWAEDVANARPDAPVRLRLVGKIVAGAAPTTEVGPGQSVRLFTGSMLPRGADAVVMQEDTRTDSDPAEFVSVLEGIKPFENVRLRGEDVRRGSVLAEAGDVMTAGQISLLSAAGIATVTAARQPVVGLLATGSELEEPGNPLAPGHIYESNRSGLAPLVRRAGGIPQIFPLVGDVLAATREAFERALEACDVVITSGGVSVGEMDLVKSAFAEAGGELNFWKVAIRPGRPFVFGRRAGKYWFGLPGNPVSAMVSFALLAYPALRRWQGANETALPMQWGVLGEALANHGERRHFHRVRIDGSGKVYSAGLQASHALSSLALANGLVDVPPQTTLPAGKTVPVMACEG